MAVCGPAAGGSLVINGDYVVTEGVVEDVIVNGQIQVRGSDVTLRNVQAQTLWQVRGNSGLEIYDSSFVSPDTGSGFGMVLQPDALVQDTLVQGHKDGIYFETGGPGTLRNVHVDIRSDLPDNHSDGITLPFAPNYSGVAGFVIEDSTIWAEGKTAAINQQGIPVTVVNSEWSGAIYTNPGSRFIDSFADNPDDVRLLGDVVPWEVSWEEFNEQVLYDVQALDSAANYEKLVVPASLDVPNTTPEAVLAPTLATPAKGLAAAVGAPAAAPVAVPEPAAALLVGSGALLLIRRRMPTEA
jgi:hypothetical protein